MNITTDTGLIPTTCAVHSGRCLLIQMKQEGPSFRELSKLNKFEQIWWSSGRFQMNKFKKVYEEGWSCRGPSEQVSTHGGRSHGTPPL